MRARPPVWSVAVALAAATVAVGCASRPPTVRTAQGEAVPLIEVSPGVAGRLAVMDAYRLHDEDRKHMMWRPRVTVEELPAEEAAEAEEAAAPSEEAAPAAAKEADGDLDLGVSATTRRPDRTSK